MKILSPLLLVDIPSDLRRASRIVTHAPDLRWATFGGTTRRLTAGPPAARLILRQGIADSTATGALLGWLSDLPGTGAPPLAIGALPFDALAPATMLVPSLTLSTDDQGVTTAIAVGPDPESMLDEFAEDRIGNNSLSSPLIGDAGPDISEFLEFPTPAEYAGQVTLALERIHSGRFEKVVLARTVEARLADPLDIGAALNRIIADEPDCTAFSIPLSTGTFFGASPELLIRRSGDEILSHPLAGTARNGADLEGSEKEHFEHRLVVDAVAAALTPFCSTLDVPPQPELVPLRHVTHFGTRIEGRLADPAPSALDLARLLHPTPAVGGVPRSEALAFTETTEVVPRGPWAGPLGWVDAEGDGEWIVAIRSAHLSCDRRQLRLTAGAGIVAGSTPDAELAETTLKLAPLLEAASPGASRLL